MVESVAEQLEEHGGNGEAWEAETEELGKHEGFFFLKKQQEPAVQLEKRSSGRET